MIFSDLRMMFQIPDCCLHFIHGHCDIFTILGIVVCLSIWRRSPIYRYSKSFVRILIILGVLLRAFDAKSESILTIMHNMITSHGPVAGHIIGDLVGLCLCMGLSCILIKLTWAVTNPKETSQRIQNHLFEVAKKYIPSVKAKVDEEKQKTILALGKQLRGNLGFEPYKHIPEEGVDHEELISLMTEMGRNGEEKWKNGRVSGAVYHGGDEHAQLMDVTFGLFSMTNPLHPDVWPIQSRMEAEIVSMTANLLNGGRASVCGALTVGGTESIILAVKTHRDWFRDEFGICKGGEIVCGLSAHIAVEKACDLLGLTLIRVPLKDDFRVDIRAMERAISSKTIMLYASAPQFPQVFCFI